ncbi:MAG: YceI family protein [Blastocatellia bacterium]
MASGQFSLFGMGLRFRVALMLAAVVMLFAITPAQRQKTPAAAKPVAAGGHTFTVTPAQSRITLTLTQEGMIRVRYPRHLVAVKSFSGTINAPGDDESKAVVDVQAEAKSLVNIDEKMSDFERRDFQKILHGNVLESERHPALRFRSVSITDFRTSGETQTLTLHGDLTLHGATRRVSFPVSLTRKNEQLRASGETRIRQTDFGMTPYSGALGSIKIGNEIKVSFEITAK